MNYAVKHPIQLEVEKLDVLSDDFALVAVDVEGNRVTIIASRERWQSALWTQFGPRPSPAETARSMYERDEVPLEVFERALDKERRRFG